MAKYSMKDRKDMSMGTRDYDKGYARGRNERYMPKGMNKQIMGHDKRPMEISVPAGQGFSEVKPFKSGNLGYPSKAFDYKY